MLAANNLACFYLAGIGQLLTLGDKLRQPFGG
jgi:hypothetical protein